VSAGKLFQMLTFSEKWISALH